MNCGGQNRACVGQEEAMAASQSGGKKHGIPQDTGARKKIRDGLSDQEKTDFDAIVDKIDKGKKPDRNQRKKIRQWQNQGKITVPSKSFKSPSDKKTHQDP
jgi:hypothetical protein